MGVAFGQESLLARLSSGNCKERKGIVMKSHCGSVIDQMGLEPDNSVSCMFKRHYLEFTSQVTVVGM